MVYNMCTRISSIYIDSRKCTYLVESFDVFNGSFLWVCAIFCSLSIEKIYVGTCKIKPQSVLFLVIILCAHVFR